MDRHIIFAIFCSIISLVTLVGIFFVHRSNRKFLEAEREAERLKEFKSNP